MKKTCPECGEAFTTPKSRKKFCGNQCRYAHAKKHPNAGTWKPGRISEKWMPVGSETIRTEHVREGRQRAWIKLAEPNVWKPRAVIAWEQANGPIPPGMVVHHRDRDTLNDAIENLSLISRPDHLREHREEFEATRSQRALAARWGAHAVPPSNESC